MKADAASPQTAYIDPNGCLVLQISGSSVSLASYDVTVVSGPNVDVILTDAAGYVDYMNGVLEPSSYSLQGTFLDTRHAAYYGDMAEGINYLIVDNTVQGSAQPNGQTVQITYYARAIIPGVQSSSASVSIDDILLGAGLILLFAMAVIAILLTVSKSLKMKQSRLPFYDRHESDPLHLESSSQFLSRDQKPRRIYLQSKNVVQPILVHAIGRCPSCNGIIAKEWQQCSKCGWTVDRSKLRPFSREGSS